MTLILRRSLNAFGKSDFAKILADELGEFSSELPLEDCMENGGYPDYESVEMTITNVTIDAECINADINIWFEENVPSSCADIVHTENYFGTFKLTLDKQDATADIEHESHKCTTPYDNPDDDETDEERIGMPDEFDYLDKNALE